MDTLQSYLNFLVQGFCLFSNIIDKRMLMFVLGPFVYIKELISIAEGLYVYIKELISIAEGLFVYIKDHISFAGGLFVDIKELIKYCWGTLCFQACETQNKLYWISRFITNCHSWDVTPWPLSSDDFDPFM